ncbi:MAG: mandelate racemase/muconate lactonizing enzyme family protein [Planctomycetota bacterium]|jgi:L-alanine-DL-glutamate epimerase-like enolase superfamily enzyme
MTISDLEFFCVEMARDRRPASVRSVLVRLATDAGLEGWGEARLTWRPSELAARRDRLLPVLTGRSVFDIEDLLRLDALASPPLRCGLEMASWDLVGRILRQPLCNLFGGMYRRRIPLAVRLAGRSVAEVVPVARELAGQGFHTQIVSSTGRPARDLDIMAAIRETTGDRVELRLDAAACYDMETARDLCTELESHGVQFALDPLLSNELDQVAALRRQTSVPLAVWRAIHSPADVLMMVRCGAAPFAVVDMQLVGGILAARQCAAIAQAGGVSTSLGGGPSLGIGVAAMLQLAASTPALASCNECAHHHLTDDLLVEPLETIDGMITVPQAPGLGVEIDRAKMEQYQAVS